MMFRRIDKQQPSEFKFSKKNLSWAKKQISKYPQDRQQSAVIPLLYRAQEQEGWVSKPAIEEIAKMLKMAPIRVYEVASFYFMFHLSVYLLDTALYILLSLTKSSKDILILFYLTNCVFFVQLI